MQRIKNMGSVVHANMGSQPAIKINIVLLEKVSPRKHDRCPIPLDPTYAGFCADVYSGTLLNVGDIGNV